MRRVHSLLRAAFHGWAAPRGFTKIFLCILVAMGGVIINAEAFSKSPDPNRELNREKKLDTDNNAPVDYGFGPGAGKGPARPHRVLGITPAIPQAKRSAPQAQAQAIALTAPIGGGGGGFFDVPIPWPIIPIHMALLPDGRVMSYGTDDKGKQGAQLIYDVWNLVTGAHTTLPNTTSTDIFCAAQSLIGIGLAGPTSLTNNLLITGGDLTVDGVRGYSNDNVNVFNPGNNTLTASGTMNYKRWYPSITSLRNGDKLVLGGQLNLPGEPFVAAATPEVFNPASGIWTKLTGISINDWYYPRGFLAFDGSVIVIQSSNLNSGGSNIARITTGGAGTKTNTGSLTAAGNKYYPAAMFAPFKVLAVRANQIAQVVDFSSSSSSLKPVVTPAGQLNYDRRWGHATVLPDGKILVTGGSGTENQLVNVAYQAEIFNPSLGTWTLGASASKPRLYHSSALLLPDGSVLTGGGGAAGPIKQLNVEIYYPAYLYLNDGSGNPAPRPTIVSAPSTLNLGQNFSVTVGDTDQIGNVNLVRAGSSTHTIDPEQRLIPVPFSQDGTTVTGSVDPAPEKIPPGYYMLFVFNTNGVPAVAPIIPVPQAVP